MAFNDMRNSTPWTWIHVSVILCCIAMVLYPPIRHFRPFMVPFTFGLMPACFYLHVQSLREDGAADLSPYELYAEVQRGRRLPGHSALLWATATALLSASVFAPTGSA